MIYEFPDISMPLRQGDIFVGLPRIDISLQEIVLAEDSGERLLKWDDLATTNQSVKIIVPVQPVAAIIATQDCDSLRSRDITLCEIRDFRSVEGKSNDKTSVKGLVRIITQHARINQKWFYLPPDNQLGFTDKMAADFTVTLRIPREDLETVRFLRRGRLNDIADEHFRERISEFFRRYPYDEWYALNKEEMSAYQAEHHNCQPYPWQLTNNHK